MTYFYVITLLAVIACISASSNSGNDGSDTCLSTSSLKFIEPSLANISKQLGHIVLEIPLTLKNLLLVLQVYLC